MDAVWAHPKKKPIELRRKKFCYGSNRTRSRDPVEDSDYGPEAAYPDACR